MHAGRLRHQFTIESATEVVDSVGQPVKTWGTFATVWGSVQPVAGSKPLVSKASVAVATTASPVTPKKSGWVINLLSLTSARTANSELARLRKLGIRADKQTVGKDGQAWYRRRVTGFDSYAGAKAYIETVEKQTGFNSAWVAKE